MLYYKSGWICLWGGDLIAQQPEKADLALACLLAMYLYTYITKWNFYYIIVFTLLDCQEYGDVSNGKVKVLANTTILYTMQIMCDKGYKLKGIPVNHCKKGKWTYQKATCKGVHVIMDMHG